jgi:hypothetical protein
MSSGDATVSGSVDLTVCKVMQATLGNPPPATNIVAKGSLMTIAATSGPAPVPTNTPSSGGGSGNAGAQPSPTAGVAPSTGGSEDWCTANAIPTPATGTTVTSSSPANCATGVSTTPAISVTFSAAPGNVVLMLMQLDASGQPAGQPMMLTPQVSGTTISATPPSTLQSGTVYQLMITQMGGGMPAIIKFKTA